MRKKYLKCLRYDHFDYYYQCFERYKYSNPAKKLYLYIEFKTSDFNIIPLMTKKLKNLYHNKIAYLLNGNDILSIAAQIFLDLKDIYMYNDFKKKVNIERRKLYL